MSESLESAADEFVNAIATSLREIRGHEFYGDPENRASAHTFLASMLLSRIEEDVVFDGDFPYFRVLDHRIREGGDNPDQRYLISKINGAHSYRVWGTLGSARRVDVQIYAGDPYIAGSGGRAASFLTFEQLQVGADGSFEIAMSPQHRGEANWIENPADATRVLIRQVFGEWADEHPGEVHIDHAGRTGDLKPVLSDAEVAARLRTAAANLVAHVKVWPDMVLNGYVRTGPPNEVSAPFDPGSRGGVPGRYMCHAIFELEADEALVVTTWPMNGNYQGVQLGDMWFSSLEYGNRQSSLSGDQARPSPDGALRFVICSADPGYANWLDTVGRRRGTVLLRYDGMTGGFPPEHYPQAQKVRLDDLATALGDAPQVTPAERAAALAARRRHLQRRYGV